SARQWPSHRSGRTTVAAVLAGEIGVRADRGRGRAIIVLFGGAGGEHERAEQPGHDKGSQTEGGRHARIVASSSPAPVRRWARRPRPKSPPGQEGPRSLSSPPRKKPPSNTLEPVLSFLEDRCTTPTQHRPPLPAVLRNPPPLGLAACSSVRASEQPSPWPVLPVAPPRMRHRRCTAPGDTRPMDTSP